MPPESTLDVAAYLGLKVVADEAMLAPMPLHRDRGRAEGLAWMVEPTDGAGVMKPEKMHSSMLAVSPRPVPFSPPPRST